MYKKIYISFNKCNQIPYINIRKEVIFLRPLDFKTHIEENIPSILEE